MSTIAPMIDALRSQVRVLPPARRLGHVTGVTGLIIESEGPNVGLGELCQLRSERDNFSVMAEVVGFRGERVLLMPLGEVAGLHSGCEVAACDRPPLPLIGDQLLGRVLDALGKPYDGLGLLAAARSEGSARPPHPLRRQRIRAPFETGVRAIDTFIPFGRGQRLGLFAGSGVGKSTLMGMIARGAEADVVVIALVGERGREVREFIEKDLGPEGMARAVGGQGSARSPRERARLMGEEAQQQEPARVSGRTVRASAHAVASPERRGVAQRAACFDFPRPLRSHTPPGHRKAEREIQPHLHHLRSGRLAATN